MLGFNDSFKNRTLVHAIGQGHLPSKDQHNGRSTLNMFHFKWLKMLHYPDRNDSFQMSHQVRILITLYFTIENEIRLISLKMVEKF